MNINLIKLKIKAKHLAEEAKIIRFEENKLKEMPFHKRSEVVKHNYGGFYTICYLSSIKEHRRWDVRNEARSTQLAIAYLKGKKYLSVEKLCTDPTKRNFCIVPRVLKIVQKYGDKNTTQQNILDWINQ